MLGEVQPRPGEPPRARHRLGREDGAVRSVRLHLEELPDRRPERGQIRDRPALQLVVVGEGEAALVLEPGQVTPDLGRLPDVRRRRPEDARARRRHDRILTPRFHQSGRCLDKWSTPLQVSKAVAVGRYPCGRGEELLAIMGAQSLAGLLQSVGNPVDLVRNSQIGPYVYPEGPRRVLELARRAARLAGDVLPLRPVASHDRHVHQGAGCAEAAVGDRGQHLLELRGSTRPSSSSACNYRGQVIGDAILFYLER